MDFREIFSIAEPILRESEWYGVYGPEGIIVCKPKQDVVEELEKRISKDGIQKKMRKKHRYNKWKDGWEKIEPSKVPRWVLYSGVQPDYFQCVELKGKHYRYLICSEPRYQGDKRLIYYRKLRRKWRKKEET